MLTPVRKPTLTRGRYAYDKGLLARQLSQLLRVGRRLKLRDGYRLAFRCVECKNEQGM